jgi:hypothetical protein
MKKSILFLSMFLSLLFLNAFHNPNPRANSNNLIKCSYCEGSGDCSYCSGTGSIICQKCEGTGKVKWYYETASNGVKYEVGNSAGVWTVNRGEYEIRECGKCMGEKKLACKTCNRSGKCQYCKGTGNRK